MKYIVGFKQYGVELPNSDNLKQAYLDRMGGPQNCLEYIFRHLIIMEDNTKEATIIEDKQE